MRITPSELAGSEQYVKMAELNHQNLLPFVFQYIKVKTRFNIFLWIFNILFLVMALGQFITALKNGQITTSGFFLYTGTGTVLFLVLVIPLHELIHLAAMKLLGAKKLKVSADLKKGLFYAFADNFVITRHEFYLIALLPFALINAALLVWIFLSSGDITWGLWLVFIMHSTGCLGDFALMSYYEVNKDKEILTFDDFVTRKSYFYEKMKSI